MATARKPAAGVPPGADGGLAVLRAATDIASIAMPANPVVTTMTVTTRPCMLDISVSVARPTVVVGVLIAAVALRDRTRFALRHGRLLTGGRRCPFRGASGRGGAFLVRGDAVRMRRG